MKVVETCSYYNAKNRVEWKMIYENDETVLIKQTSESSHFSLNFQKKKMKKEYLSNLDIFFGTYLIPENESSNSQDDLVSSEVDWIWIVSEGKDYFFSAENMVGEANIFEDIQRYFTVCFEEKMEPICFSFHSFEGGGPEYSLETEVKGIFTWYSKKHYYREDHEMLCGAGFDVEFTLYPLRTGHATAILKGDSPICPEPPRRVFVDVDENLKMTYHMEKMEFRPEEG